MQHFTFVARSVVTVLFQYPQSDRRRCNFPQPDANNLADDLSVSSIGSEAMQLVEMTGGPEVPEAFSILNRIGGDATS